MEQRILEIINVIRESKGQPMISTISSSDSLRNTYGFSSFDLAELTVRIEDEFGVDIFEDGLVDTVGEVIDKLQK